LVAAGLVLFVRHRTPGRDRGSLVDASIITIGLGLLVWVYLAAPYARDTSSSLAGRVVSVAYPLVDVLLIAVLARLLVSLGAREKSQYFLLGFLLATLASDVIYSAIVLFAHYNSGDLIDSGWLVAYVLVGAAGLHPSMARLSTRVAQPAPVLRRTRLALLGVASLIAPGVLAVEWSRGKPLEIPVVAMCAGALFLLVVVRMSGLVREVHAQLQVVEVRDASLASALADLRRAQGERKRLLERTIRAAEDERLQMAAELHDGPIQHLAALGYSLESASTVMEEDPGGGRRLVRHVQEGLSDEIRGLRQLMVTLRPPALDQAGLHMALRDFAEAVGSQEGLEASIHVDEVGGLTPEAETVLYRVAQEALRNVVRHAQAGVVTVTLRAGVDAAEVLVEDDGVGFSDDGADFVKEGHFGIAGMRQRVEMVGGTLEIVSSPERGTRVRARVPSARSEEPRPSPSSDRSQRPGEGRRSRPGRSPQRRRARVRAGRER
jgi:signal transduction histidine kinase